MLIVIGCVRAGAGATMVKSKNQPHMFGPKDVSMDSCQNFPYAYGNIFLKSLHEGFQGVWLPIAGRKDWAIKSFSRTAVTQCTLRRSVNRNSPPGLMPACLSLSLNVSGQDYSSL